MVHLYHFILTTTLWDRYYYFSYLTDGLREARWHALYPTASKWPSWDVSPGSFTPEPMASSLVLHSIPPLLWVLGGGSRLRREHKDAFQGFTVQERRQGDRRWQYSYNEATRGGNVPLVLWVEWEVKYSWGHPARLSEGSGIPAALWRNGEDMEKSREKQQESKIYITRIIPHEELSSTAQG